MYFQVLPLGGRYVRWSKKWLWQWTHACIFKFSCAAPAWFEPKNAFALYTCMHFQVLTHWQCLTIYSTPDADASSLATLEAPRNNCEQGWSLAQCICIISGAHQVRRAHPTLIPAQQSAFQDDLAASWDEDRLGWPTSSAQWPCPWPCLWTSPCWETQVRSHFNELHNNNKKRICKWH